MTEAALNPLVEVVGRGFTARGELQDAHRRVSDHFNEQRHMVFLDHTTLTGVPTFARKSAHLGINRDDIVMVIPLKESRFSGAVRVEKERLPVRMLVERWQVDGDLSLVPGVSLERFVNIGPESFVPMLDAHLVGPRTERREALILVRRELIRLLVPGGGQSSQASSSTRAGD